MKVRDKGGGGVPTNIFRGLRVLEELRFFSGGGGGVEICSGMDQIISVYRIEIY